MRSPAQQADDAMIHAAPAVSTDGLPVNYHARAAGSLARLLELLDTIDETHPRVTRGRRITYALARIPEPDRQQAEQALYALLVANYRAGRLP